MLRRPFWFRVTLVSPRASREPTVWFLLVRAILLLTPRRVDWVERGAADRKNREEFIEESTRRREGTAVCNGSKEDGAFRFAAGRERIQAAFHVLQVADGIL